MKKNYIKSYCLILAISCFGGWRAQAQDTKDSLQNNQDSLVQDSLVNVAFKTVAKADLLGGVSSVNVSDLLKKSYGTYSLDNLQSFVGGYTGNIWGQAGLILVDGVPRNASDINMVEVESVTVLKGASAVALYGSNAAKGVVLITTKRGEIKPLHLDVRFNTGINTPKGYPTYLNAAEYMTLYNEAAKNDGIGAKYTPEQIYNTAAGTNPYEYPDVNFFSSDYLKNFYTKSDLTTEISGGNKHARYYNNIGLSYNDDILKYGDSKNNNTFSFNVRSNVDMNLTKWLSAYTNAVVSVDDNYASRGDFWGTSATLRPNLFSPLIPVSMLDPYNTDMQTVVNNSNHLIDGQYLLGGISTNTTNAFSDMLAAGYIKTRNRKFMFDLGAKADLSSILQGLDFKAGYSMDYSTMYNEAYNLPYAVYEPIWSNIDGQTLISGLTQYNEDKNATSEYIGENRYIKTMSFRSQFDYNRTFAKDHNVSATLLGWGYTIENSNDAGHNGSDYQPVRNANLGLQAGYNYRQKYYFDFTGALVHSAKLAPGNRDAFSPTVTLGWRLSDEDFFKNNVSFVNNLKLSASYASLNQDLDISDYYLYQVDFNYGGGWYQWRDGVAGGNTTTSVRSANPDLGFVKRKEFRVGLDASLWNNLVTLNSNYFIQNTDGLPMQATSLYPSYFSSWDFSFLPYVNYNNDRRTGIDYSFNLNKKIGQIQYSLGFTGMYFTSKATFRDDVAYTDEYQYRTGKPLDAYWGYISEGIFMNQEEIDNHAKQTFGDVMPGDIKYKDVNGDGVIDTKDQVNLGHNGWDASPFTYGINFTMKWKNLTLFAVANGQSGAIGFKNTGYYWVNGSGKYSDVVLDRTIIEQNANNEWEVTHLGSYPRLTTTTNSNNFQNSTYWMYKNNRFNLTRVQLTYDFNSRIFNNSFIHGLSIYANGDNLLVISKERKMMETNVGSAPQYRFYNIGLKASF